MTNLAGYTPGRMMHNVFTSGNIVMDETLYRVGDVPKIQNRGQSANPIPYTGNNSEHLLVVYKPASGSTLADEALTTLRKIVQATGTDPDCAALVAYEPIPIHHITLYKRYFTPRRMLSFGVRLQDIGIFCRYDFYSAFSLSGICIIACDAVSHLDAERKKRLWQELNGQEWKSAAVIGS